MHEGWLYLARSWSAARKPRADVGDNMAKHGVRFTLPERELGRADATFKVQQDGSVLGTLHVSNGSLVWFPHKNSYGHKLTWSQFHDLALDHGKKSEKR